MIDPIISPLVTAFYQYVAVVAQVYWAVAVLGFIGMPFLYSIANFIATSTPLRFTDPGHFWVVIVVFTVCVLLWPVVAVVAVWLLAFHLPIAAGEKVVGAAYGIRRWYLWFRHKKENEKNE